MRPVFLFAALIALAGPPAAGAGPSGHTHAAPSASARGGPGNPAEAQRTVRVEARDVAFDVKQIRVRSGETIRFLVTNTGEAPHEFAIGSPEEQEEHRAMMRDKPEMVHEDANVVTVQPGETKELVWRFGADAPLEFSCNLPGHAEQGMTGSFRVVR
jgi:uncharacterized cupredoxin-like copper-binding protein